jgi:hypothetical protein
MADGAMKHAVKAGAGWSWQPPHVLCPVRAEGMLLCFHDGLLYAYLKVSYRGFRNLWSFHV